MLPQGQRVLIRIEGKDFGKKCCAVSAGEHLAPDAVLGGMPLEEGYRKATKPAEVIAQGTLAGSAVVFAKRDIQDPMHGLNTPVTANRLRETLAAQITRADVVAHLARLPAIGVLREADGITDRLDGRPVARRGEVARHLGQGVGAFIDAAMSGLTRFMVTVLKVFNIAFDLFPKMRFDGVFEFGLVVLGGNDRVAAAGNNRFDNVL